MTPQIVYQLPDNGTWWEEEKGSAERFNSAHLTGNLLGYDAQPDPVSGDKVERAKPLASAAEHGHVFIVDAPWNSEYLAEMGAFPRKKKDQCDGTTGCLKCLTHEKRVWAAFLVSRTKKITIDWSQPSK